MCSIDSCVVGSCSAEGSERRNARPLVTVCVCEKRRKFRFGRELIVVRNNKKKTVSCSPRGRRVTTILVFHLGVPFSWIPHNLTHAQKPRRVNWCREVMQRFTSDDSNAVVYEIHKHFMMWGCFKEIYCCEVSCKRGSMQVILSCLHCLAARQKTAGYVRLAGGYALAKLTRLV
ncbi:hypothetical protein EVAR_75984_1 [Eumeta japonica]|uniref:Uncharacterized protein n=1 Tax=Eumeta variegata TaxID=151549 RepID=A0A4C1UA71_EUMVA|nr:hypothetical protein EVAR_75984_1 [Eumeta japonica]